MSISKCACLLLSVVTCFVINISESASVQENNQNEFDMQMVSTDQWFRNPLFRIRRSHIDENENCGPHDLEMVHTIMDRICMLCHELRSHFAPNTRVECRKDCFRNTTFQLCMRIFSGGSPKPGRPDVEPTAPVPLYTEEAPTLDEIKERRRRI